MSRKIPRPMRTGAKCFPFEGELSAKPTEEVGRDCCDRAALGFPSEGELSAKPTEEVDRDCCDRSALGFPFGEAVERMPD